MTSVADGTPNASIVEPVYLPIQPGIAGERSKRPSEKKIEAKDSIRMLAPSLMVQQRLVAPQAMLSGGGSCDFVMRGSFASRNKLIVTAVIPAAADTIPATASFTRAGTYNYGPTRAWSENGANTGQMPAVLGGLPVPIETFYQSIGGWTYELDSLMQLIFAGADITTGFPGTDMDYVTAIHCGTGSTNYAAVFLPVLLANLGANTTTQIATQITNFVRMKSKLRISPVGLSQISGSHTVSSLAVMLEQRMEWFSNDAIVYAKGGVSNFIIDVPPSQQFLYLDAGMYMNFGAFTAGGSSAQLLMSSGRTLSASDGYPYLMKQADIADVTE